MQQNGGVPTAKYPRTVSVDFRRLNVRTGGGPAPSTPAYAMLVYAALFMLRMHAYGHSLSAASKQTHFHQTLLLLCAW